MHIGIIGASGEVGRMMIRILEEKKIKIDKISLFSSSKSAGEKVQFNGNEFIIKELSENDMKKKYDYLLFSAGSSVSKKYATVAAEYDNVVIDNSSAFRDYDAIPLVIPEINGNILKNIAVLLPIQIAQQFKCCLF